MKKAFVVPILRAEFTLSRLTQGGFIPIDITPCLVSCVTHDGIN